MAVTSSNIISASTNDTYWQSLNRLFFTSGSPTLTEIYHSGSQYQYDKFDLPHTNYALHNGKQNLNKFHYNPSSSLFSISGYHYGNSIRRGSFKLTDNSHPSGSVIIVDDGYGNLYGVSASISASSDSAISSSTNYVGNVFYDWGIAVVSDSGSYSHTPSTSSITVGASNMSHISGSHFFVSNSAGTSIKFISTGSTETDTSTVKYFKSGSTTAVTAASASIKINETFAGTHISASSVSNVITMSNDANLLFGRVPSNRNDNLPAISGAGGFNTTVGFGGGKANIEYNEIGTNWEIKFDASHKVYTNEYTITLQPNEFNHSMNYTLRCFPSSSQENNFDSGSFLGEATHLCSEFTGSEFQPYITTIHLYNANDMMGEPVMTAKLPKPIRKSDRIPQKFVIRIDR
tara:strand:+ start:8354 stop:9565 length:1212 start_codon:yes stop_codon:yes gene_type:complete